MNAIAPRTRSPLKFFLLVFTLSLPLMAIGAVTDLELVPGLPVWIVPAAFAPLAAASILVHREGGAAAVLALLRRSFDYRRITAKVWYVPIVLLMPAVTVVTRGLMHQLGVSRPAVRFSLLAAPATLLMWFVLALGEELGWSGYVIDPLQDRWNALGAGVLLGLVWAAWHIGAMLPLGPAWIAWGCLDMVATRVLFTWLYNNAGKSVFAIALCHAIANFSIKTMFPGGSYEAERIITLILVLAAATVTALWGTRTLSAWRFSATGRSAAS